jgi:hypothetical protein
MGLVELRQDIVSQSPQNLDCHGEANVLEEIPLREQSPDHT